MLSSVESNSIYTYCSNNLKTFPMKILKIIHRHLQGFVKQLTENNWKLAMDYGNGIFRFHSHIYFLCIYLKEKLIPVGLRISRDNVSFSSSLRRRTDKATFPYSRKLVRTTLHHLSECMDKTEAGLRITKESVSQVISDHCVCRLEGVVFIWIKLS